jgi:hypothetical protein
VRVVSTFSTQSRIAADTASLSVRAPALHRLDARAQQLHPLHVGLLATDVLLAHVDDALEVEQRAGGRAATPCWPAPVSAITRRLPIRRASSAWPSALLILCEPVWLRSSRFSQSG